MVIKLTLNYNLMIVYENLTVVVTIIISFFKYEGIGQMNFQFCNKRPPLLNTSLKIRKI